LKSESNYAFFDLQINFLACQKSGCNIVHIVIYEHLFDSCGCIVGDVLYYLNALLLGTR
jgi:hypothetical protein